MRLLWLFLFLGMVSPRAWGRIPFVVDLDENPTLAGIFKSGLRPLNVRGLENLQCEIRPAEVIVFKVGGITTPPLEAVWELTAGSTGKLIRVTGYTQTPWTVPQAEEIMAPMEEVLGRKSDEMRAFLRGYPETSTNGDMWGNRFKSADNVRIGYYFRHSMQPTRPFLATFYIDWTLPRKEREKGSEPLKPPPGYEDFDMRPLDVQEYEKWKHSGGAAREQAEKSLAPPISTQTPKTGWGFWWWIWLPLLVILVLLVHKLDQAQQKCRRARR